MAKRTGAETDIGLAISSVFGQAVAAAETGGKCLVNSLSQSRNPQILRDSAIGSGNLMDGIDTCQGHESATVTIEKDLRYNDVANAALAQMFGGASVTELASGAYSHSILMNETANQFWVTAAAGLTTTEVAEFPSCAVRGVNISADSFPGPVKASFDMIANERLITGTTNSTASLAAATVANTKRIIADKDDYFLFNAQAGAALGTSDKKAVKSWSINFARPQEHVSEMKGSAGNAEPTITGDPVWRTTVSCTFKNLADFTFFTAAEAGTAYKASFQITGEVITGAFSYFIHFNFPYLKVLEDPGYNLSSVSENEHTVVFEALMAATAPTGMLSVYPYILLQNDRSTPLLAV